jgi:D-arabinose 1-dehydrogenase-like Zn-dependent alcohol dehydrogenase
MMFCPYLKRTGTDVQGSHAEYRLMNADATYLIPDQVSYEQAAPISCAGYTVIAGSAKMIRDLGADEIVRDGKSLGVAEAPM